MFFYMNAKATSTRNTYNSVARRFISFCGTINVVPSSATYAEMEYTVALFASSLAKEGHLAFGSVSTYVSAVRSWILEYSAGSIALQKSHLISMVMKGIRRELGHRPKQKLPITLDMLQQFLDINYSTKFIFVRDYTAFLVAFFGFLRKSELVRICWNHIHFSVRQAKIWIPYSKTDQNQHGCFITLARRSHLPSCPVGWLLRLQSFGFDSGPVFRSMNGKKILDTGMSTSAFVSRVKLYVRLIHLDPEDFSGHSFRRGGASAAAAAGVPDRLIQIQGRWISDCYKRYIEESEDNLLSITATI